VLYALEMLESMRCVLLCVLEAVEGELCFVLEVIPCVLFCTLEAAEGELCLLEVLEGTRGVGGAGGDALCATPYAGDCGECALFEEM